MNLNRRFTIVCKFSSHGGGPNASRSVIQAWKRQSKQYYLIDQYCEQCDAEDLRRAFWLFVRKYSPSVALIENTANGPALYARVRQKAKFGLKLITPRRVSKAVRFNDHLPKIRNKHIHLPENAIWREAFIAEVVGFPGEFDDQVDAMTPVSAANPTRENMDRTRVRRRQRNRSRPSRGQPHINSGHPRCTPRRNRQGATLDRRYHRGAGEIIRGDRHKREQGRASYSPACSARLRRTVHCPVHHRRNCARQSHGH